MIWWSPSKVPPCPPTGRVPLQLLLLLYSNVNLQIMDTLPPTGCQVCDTAGQSFEQFPLHLMQARSCHQPKDKEITDCRQKGGKGHCYLAKARHKLIKALESHHTARVWASQVPPGVQASSSYNTSQAYSIQYFQFIDLFKWGYCMDLHFDKTILISCNSCVLIYASHTVEGGIVTFQVLAPGRNCLVRQPGSNNVLMLCLWDLIPSGKN